MSAVYRMECPTCGHVGTYKSAKIAAHHFPRHSCALVIERRERSARRVARARAEGVKRDCACRNVRHEHGTSTAYVVDRCRCRACRDANTAAAAERNRAKLYGRWDALVDATPAREHLQSLMAQGMGPKRIVEVSGIGHGSISAILYGKPMRDPKQARPPRKRISRDLHERIMAVRLDLAPSVRVDSIGTVRRLRALVAIGWSQSKLARRLGMHPANFGAMLRARQVHQRTAQAVKALYEELWDQPPPTGTGYERAAAARAKAYAAEHGWPPPMAWDDDRIDDRTARTPRSGRAA